MKEEGASFHRGGPGSLEFPPLCDIELSGGSINISARLFGITLRRFPSIPLGKLQSATIERRKNAPYVVLTKDDRSQLAFSTDCPREWAAAFGRNGIKIESIYENPVFVRTGLRALRFSFTLLAVLFGSLIAAVIFLLSRQGR